MTADTSLGPDYFERVYAANTDPWDFAGSAYEAAKYRESMAALPPGRFARSLEIGCSIGVLTRMLAERCDALIAVDVSEVALAEARRRTADRPQVELMRLQVPRDYPPGSFDLVVVSEVGYYWSRADLASAATRIVASLRPGGALLLVHWTPPVHDYPLDGDAVHGHFIALAANGDGTARALRHVHGERFPSYRLDLLIAS